MRVALGASPQSVIRLILVSGMRPVIIGVVAGLAAASALSRFLSSLLFGVTPHDGPTYVGVTAALLVAAAVACYLPARQALRSDIVTSLMRE